MPQNDPVLKLATCSTNDMIANNPSATSKLSPEDIPEFPLASGVNWPDFAGAGMGLQFVSWGLVSIFPSWILMSLTLIISFGRHGDYPWQWLLWLVTPFAISALPILGGILCLSAPVSGRGKAQLVASILVPAVPWLWLLLEAMKSAHISSFYSTSDFLLATPVLVISIGCFTLFVQHFVTAIDRSDFAPMARTLTVSLIWLSAVSICGLLGFELLFDGRQGSPVPGMAAFLIFGCACVFQLWTFAFASFLKTLRKVIREETETTNRQK